MCSNIHRLEWVLIRWIITLFDRKRRDTTIWGYSVVQEMFHFYADLFHLNWCYFDEKMEQRVCLMRLRERLVQSLQNNSLHGKYYCFSMSLFKSLFKGDADPKGFCAVHPSSTEDNSSSRVQG